MQRVLNAQANLTLVEGAVDNLISKSGTLSGVSLEDGTVLNSRAVVLTTGTFLNGLCHQGKAKFVGARHGDRSISTLSAILRDLGVRLRRFKTGTTPRVSKKSLDLCSAEVLQSEPDAGPLSFRNDRSEPKHPLLGCWKVHTLPETHDLLRSNLGESALFGGLIEGVGPRYCPSIEDKVVRFADKDRHPIFLEQEEWDGDSIYVQGFSTSMPAELQLKALQTIPSLHNASMLRPGYAVEYDMADPLQLDATLMSLIQRGLFFAGQINGTSGYEEAAAQGIVAGINAALHAWDEPAIVFSRENSFLGVMIDDLVTKGVDDPYRMLTARAEHRLLLRHDNADQRLTPISKELGLCDEVRWKRFGEKMEAISRGRLELQSRRIDQRHSDLLQLSGIAPVANSTTFFDLMRRPDVEFERVEHLGLVLGTPLKVVDSHPVREQLKLEAMYEGYIQIQARCADRQQKLDSMPIDAAFEYQSLRGMSKESIEKLSYVRPTTVGQASRVPGVRPSDIALLIGHLRHGQARVSA